MRSELQMICQVVCSWIYLAKLSDFLIRNHKISPIDQRTESSVYLPLISFRRYVIHGWIIISVWALRASESRIMLISYIKTTHECLERILNKNMNICIHHYPILLFYAVFSLSLFDIIVILRPLRFRSIYHNSFLTPLYVSYFRVCSLAHWNVASVPPSYNLFFSLITLIWLLSSIYEKISVAYLIQFSLFVLLFLIAAVFGENFMMIAVLFTAKK